MQRFEDLVLEFAESIPLGTRDIGASFEVIVDEVQLDIPIESRIGTNGHLQATAPRGRLATGFDIPHGRVQLKLVRSIL